MKYKLFISDYDGTLGDFGGINESTVKAIKEFEKKGGKFVVCTGRMFKNIRSICDYYDAAETLVSYQGARINLRKSGETLFSGEIPRELTAEVLNSIKNLPVKPVVLSEDTLYYSQNSEYIERYKQIKVVNLVKVKNLADGIIENKFNALKINVVCEAGYRAEFIKEYGNRFKGKLIVNSGGANLAEFINPACSKGASVKFLSDYYNVAHNEIIAVGDSTNDIELLNGDWHSVAVGDADEALKSYADEIAVPFKENPVKRLLEKYCL